tara:strand:- start:3193 stop:3429 length:237 start_codon:yes stop_codon:yes gene_type:complete
MAWKDIIKVDVIGDSQKAIDVVGTQKENLDMIDEAVRKFASGEELDLEEMQRLAQSHFKHMELIKTVMITLIEKIQGA